MTSSYAGKVYRMDRASVSGALGTPLCDQLIEVDKIELTTGIDPSLGCTFRCPIVNSPTTYNSVLFQNFETFRIGEIQLTSCNNIKFNVVSFFRAAAFSSTVDTYPSKELLDYFNLYTRISKSLFDRLVAAGLFVEENAQKADDHAGMIFNPFTNSWSFGFCG